MLELYIPAEYEMQNMSLCHNYGMAWIHAITGQDWTTGLSVYRGRSAQSDRNVKTVLLLCEVQQPYVLGCTKSWEINFTSRGE